MPTTKILTIASIPSRTTSRSSLPATGTSLRRFAASIRGPAPTSLRVYWSCPMLR